MLIRNQVDGKLLPLLTIEVFLILKSQSLPVVAVDHYLSKDIPTVSSDNVHSGGKTSHGIRSFQKIVSILFILTAP